MHEINKKSVKLYFGGSYKEKWSSDYTLSVEYQNRKSVTATLAPDGSRWIASEGEENIVNALNSADKDSFFYRCFSAAADVHSLTKVCFSENLKPDALHLFVKLENNIIAAAELMRILMDDCGLSIEKACAITVDCCGPYPEMDSELQGKLFRYQPRTSHVMSLLVQKCRTDINIRHDPEDPRHRSPGFAVSCGDKVRIAFDVLTGHPRSADIIITGPGWEHVRPMDKTETGFEVTFSAPDRPGSYRYALRINKDTTCLFICPDSSGCYGVLSRHQEGFRLTVSLPGFETPAWFRKTVMYQAFPDRFARSDDGTAQRGLEYHRSLGQRPDYHASEDDPVKYLPRPGEQFYSPDDFYGGTLNGITGKLDYLKELGVGCLYLNPIVEARSNHRYDASDYLKVDPILGTLEDFTRLTEEASKRGIKLILDGVFSHTGADSIYFNKYGTYDSFGACQGKNSPYYHWYTFYDYPNVYKSWWGFADLPEVDELAADWQYGVIKGENSVVAQWLKRGASGWRLDVADELPDEALAVIRRTVKSIDPDAPIIGEVWEDAVEKESYGQKRNYALGYSLDSVMNYPFRTAVLDFLHKRTNAFQLRNFLLGQSMNYPKPVYYSLMNLLGTHDVERLKSNLATEVNIKSLSREQQLALAFSEENLKKAEKLEVLAAAIQFSIPGVPNIYYGDEQGMCGCGDPFNRGFFKDNKSPLHDVYASLAKLRNSNPCMSTGFTKFMVISTDIISIVRYNADGLDAFGEPAEESAVVVTINRGTEKAEFSLELSQLGFENCRVSVDAESYSVNIIK